MNQGVNLKLVTLDLLRSESGSYIDLETKAVSELRSQNCDCVLVYAHALCERDGWTRRKKDCLSTVTSDGMWRVLISCTLADRTS